MPAADPRVRQLTIKTGVVKRLYKEKAMYEKESRQMEEKVEQMKTNGEDEYMIKKQIEVKNESLAMLPDCKKRLRTAYDELENLLNTEKDMEECKEYTAAKAILDEAAPSLS